MGSHSGYAGRFISAHVLVFSYLMETLLSATKRGLPQKIGTLPFGVTHMIQCLPGHTQLIYVQC